ncbi:MAG: CAP domain-containing protein [Caldicoprobacterales bacterium]
MKKLRFLLAILIVVNILLAGCKINVGSPSVPSQDPTSTPPLESTEPSRGPDDSPEPTDILDPWPSPANTEDPDLSAMPTDIPTESPTPSPTPKATPSPTSTPKATKKPRPTPTATPEPTEKPTPSPTASPTQKPTALDVDIDFLSQVESEIVRLCNIEREKLGLKPLISNPRLDEIARYKSEEMGLYNYFEHKSPISGYQSWDLAKKVFAYEYRSFGENIWMKRATASNPKQYLPTFKANITASEIVDDWMNSDGHRENILSTKYGKIGVGVVVCSDLRAYATQVFSD